MYVCVVVMVGGRWGQLLGIASFLFLAAVPGQIVTNNTIWQTTSEGKEK